MNHDKALEQVWEWKDAIYDEVKDLSVKEQLSYITQEARKAGLKFSRLRLSSKVAAGNPVS